MIINDHLFMSIYISILYIGMITNIYENKYMHIYTHTHTMETVLCEVLYCFKYIIFNVLHFKQLAEEFD